MRDSTEPKFDVSRAEYAQHLAVNVYPARRDMGLRRLLARLLDVELSHNYDAEGCKRKLR